MKYIDIMSNAISHFTEIPSDFVKNYINRLSDKKDDRSVRLLNSVMDVEFPEVEGNILLEDLKQKDLNDTIGFLMNSLNAYHKEIIRQSIVN